MKSSDQSCEVRSDTIQTEQMTTDQMTTGQAALLACLLEATAPKVGNVHRGADFEDMKFYDFVVSAAAIQPVFENSASLSVGSLVLQSIRRTQASVGTNTNLGIVLLLAPLAKCSPENGISDIEQVLQQLTEQDRDDVYQAIQLAHPGGMGEVEQGNVQDQAGVSSLSLLDAMKLAQHRDSIAKQYANGFQDVFEFVQPTLWQAFQTFDSLPDAIVHAHLQVMAKIPDTLISRKCGGETAEKSASLASQIVSQCKPGSVSYYSAIEDLDFWLRSQSNQRNPGTSADLIAAGLFLLIRSGQLSVEIIKKSLRG